MDVQSDELPFDIAESLNPQHLNLILFPTEQCNFRCTYCYEDFQIGRMRDNVIHSVKNFLAKRAPTLRSLEISWFGGEPLLASECIGEISDSVMRLVAENPSLRYTANVTTNGFLLTVPLFRTLNAGGVSLYQISLDGTEEIHNQSRVTAGSKGTFEQIIARLRDIRDCTNDPVRIMLRLHYSPATWESVRELIDFINHEFSSDSRFVVYFKALERLGGFNDNKLRTFTHESQRVVEKELRGALKYERMIYDVTGDERYICYASKANSLAIRADGTIAKCTVALGDPRNSIGRITPSGELEIKSDLFSRWIQGLRTNDSDFLACPYKFMGNAIKSDSHRETIAIEAN